VDHGLSSVSNVLVSLDLALVELDYLAQLVLLLLLPLAHDQRPLKEVSDVEVGRGYLTRLVDAWHSHLARLEEALPRTADEGIGSLRPVEDAPEQWRRGA